MFCGWENAAKVFEQGKSHEAQKAFLVLAQSYIVFDYHPGCDGQLERLFFICLFVELLGNQRGPFGSCQLRQTSVADVCAVQEQDVDGVFVAQDRVGRRSQDFIVLGHVCR